jgi:hypothetical protein
MWRKHTASLVILAVVASSLFASQGQQSKSPVNCPKYSVVSSVKTSPPKNKVSVFKKQSTPACLAPAAKTNGTIKLDSIIEVSSDITTNQIWTAGNIYHIATDISVQALLVIEPGTTVMFSSGTSMYVANGGALISTGTPDNPIIYTSDSADPWYGDYYCAIYVDETASSSTKITYSYIEYAEVGICVMNNHLDTPIENNYLYSNTYGILEYGTKHTDIYNNLVYATYYYAIEVHMPSYDNQADSGSHILIQNNTFDYYQDVGILVLGVENPDQEGQVNISNNIVSGAYQYGVVLANGYMAYTLANTGYYGNATDTYVTYTNETNPVIETTMPYVNGTGILPICYLNPNSAFVNASNQYIEQTHLIGKTTDINNFPDSNKTDLGFHYPNWYFSNAGSSNLTADFDNSYTVDFNDFLTFADYWLYDYNDNNNSQDRRFDLNGDDFVNFKDFAMFADQWQQTTQSTDPNIQIQINGNPNNGYVDIGVSGYSPDTQRIFLLANGKYIGEIYRFQDGDMLTMDISGFSGGEQQLKVVSVNNVGHVTCSNIKPITFSNPLTYCALPEQYVQNQPLYFAGMYNGT